MTQAFWDSQLRFSDVVPDFPSHLERMNTESAAIPERHISRAAYGDDPRQWVEWIQGQGPAELLPVIIHGGYWRALRAEDHRLMMPAFAAQGAHVANLEYRLLPDIRLEGLIEDTSKALKLLGRRFPAAQYLLVGHSAGAHLALSALADPEISGRTRGVIALSGVYDLAPVALSFLQNELHLSEREIQCGSLHPARDRPPVLFVNGGTETHEFLRAGALMASKGRAAWEVIPNVNHMSLLWAAMARAEALTETVLQLEDTAP